jgi:protein-tyrosine-phosphatase
VDVFSAGSSPEAAIHPAARATLEGHYGIDSTGLRPKPLRNFLGQPFDFVITVCDKAAEACPVFLVIQNEFIGALRIPLRSRMLTLRGGCSNTLPAAWQPG